MCPLICVTIENKKKLVKIWKIWITIRLQIKTQILWKIVFGQTDHLHSFRTFHQFSNLYFGRSQIKRKMCVRGWAYHTIFIDSLNAANRAAFDAFRLLKKYFSCNSNNLVYREKETFLWHFRLPAQWKKVTKQKFSFSKQKHKLKKKIRKSEKSQKKSEKVRLEKPL